MSESMNIVDRQDFRTEWTKKTIERLEERRKLGGRYIELDLDAYINLLMENLSMHLQLKAVIEQQVKALNLGFPSFTMPAPAKPVDPGQDPMINCPVCESRHKASFTCNPSQR